MDSARRHLFLTLALFGGCGASGCRNQADVPEKPWNVVLVTVDTLRADRIGAYGGSVPTPEIDRLADSGVVFEQTMTVAPLTLPAHASILTGTYPMTHGVRDNGGYYVGAEQETLAETLRDHRFRTGAFVGAFVLDSRWGLSQGFERYFDDFEFSDFTDPGLANVQRRGDEVLAEALKWMGSVETERFFAWIHFYDPHTPYDPPSGFDTHASDYDGEVAFVDHLVGELVRWLEDKELRERTILVLAGDHGEGLGDHQESEHGFFVYDSTMRVPFILDVPGATFIDRRIHDQVSVIDLLPTLLDVLGLETPDAVEGASLLARLVGEQERFARLAYGETFYPRHRYGWASLRSLRDGALHFIDGPEPELFDVVADPGETRNLARERASTIARFRDELDRLETSAAEANTYTPPAEIDTETRRQLEALGYVSGRDVTATSGPGADPKTKIALHNAIEAAALDVSAGRFEDAAAKLERVHLEDDGIPEVYRLLGELHAKRGDPERASVAYRRALELDPASKAAAFGLATSHLSLGRADDAMAGLRHVLELDPKDNKSYFLLARVLIDRGDCDEALGVLDRALATTSGHAPFYPMSAECRLANDDPEGARAAIEAGLKLQPDLPRAHFWLGRILEEEGASEEARRAYERAVEIFPHDYRPYLRLAYLERDRPGGGSVGRRIAWLERAAELAPRVPETWALLAEAYLERGEQDRALEAAARALEVGASADAAILAHRVRHVVLKENQRDP